MTPEQKFARRFAQAAEDQPGVFAFRIESSHTCPGLPDWCLILAGGRVAFVELKSAKGRLETSQKVIFAIFRRLGMNVRVLTDTPNGVTVDDELIGSVFDALSKVIVEA